MDFDYLFVPAVLVVAAAAILWLAVKSLRRVRTRANCRLMALLDKAILSGLAFSVAALAACSATNALAFLRFRARHPAEGVFYQVNGHRMLLHCTGVGSPTLILDAGLGKDSLVWSQIQPVLAQSTRVCSYDRAGFGWSEAAQGPRDADHIAQDLRQLLAQAGIDGPVVLMGHSIAGLYLRDYAARFPQQVAGLIFVDSSSPLQDRNPALGPAEGTGTSQWAASTMMRAVAISGIRRFTGACAAAYAALQAPAAEALAEDECHVSQKAVEQELSHFDDSSAEALRAGGFGATPVLVLSQDTSLVTRKDSNSASSVAFAAAWNQMQEDLKRLSSRSRRVVARGGSHFVLMDRPDLIEREVPAFLAAIRGNQPPATPWGSTTVE